ncbi:MAG: WXG100 family type VII secretion target [Caldilineaceae bacterium]
MANQIVQAQYEQLDSAAHRFDQQAQSCAHLLEQVAQRADVLRQGSWVGKGSDAFVREIDSVVVPALRRLGSALVDAEKTLVDIKVVLQTADEEAAKPFRAVHAGSGTDAKPAQVSAAPASQVNTGLPPPPPPPPAPASGDGSAPHGSVTVTAQDHANRELFFGVADGADAIGMDNAARNMRHYLDNSGQPLNVDPRAMLNDLPELRKKANRAFQNDLIDGVTQRIQNDFTGQPMRFQLTTQWQPYYATKAESQDWFYATGGFSYAYGADVTVTPGADDKPHVSIDYQMHVFDRYNWDKGKGVDIGPFRVGDAQLGRLHEAGIAQEYELRGSTTPSNYSYTYSGAGVSAGSSAPWQAPDRSSRPGALVDNPVRNSDGGRGQRENRL